MSTQSLNQFDALTSIDTGDALLCYDASEDDAVLLDLDSLSIPSGNLSVQEVQVTDSGTLTTLNEGVQFATILLVLYATVSGYYTVSITSPVEGDTLILRNDSNNTDDIKLTLGVAGENTLTPGEAGWWVHDGSDFRRVA